MSYSLRLVLFVCWLVVSAQAQSLELNKPVERELSAGQTHAYTLMLTAPQIARVVAEQKGADVVIAVSLPNGTKLFDVDSPNGSTGEEVATIAAQQSGTYHIEIRSLATNAPTGRYTIRLDKLLTETEFVTERLAAVGRLWGAVKFFHPYLAYKDLDWDGALVKALPAIKAARTPNEYRQAITGLLQALDDPATKVVAAATGSNATAATSNAPKLPTYFRVVEGFVVVQALDWAKAMLSNNAASAKQPEMLAEIAKAKGVIVDCQYGSVSFNEVPPFYLSFYLNNTLPQLVQGNIPLGTDRYRIHNGYTPQTGSTSGGYTSAFITESPAAISGQATSKKPLAIIVDEKSPNMMALLSGLQAAGAKIVQVGQSSRDGAGVRQMTLTDGVQVQLRTTEFVHPNGSSIFQADAQVPRDGASEEKVIAATITALNTPSSEKTATAATATAPAMRTVKDNAYPQMSFPSEEYRLLALFRYWNVINYFFPYKHLTDKPWSTVLTDFIPRLLENKTQLDYEMTVAEMVARLQDTHGFVRGLRTLDAHLGGFAPPLSLRMASGKLTVEQVLNESAAAGVKVGDSIIAVDGESIEQRVAYLAKFKSYSSPNSAYRYVHPTALRGAQGSLAKLRVVGADGQTRDVEVARTTPLNQAAFAMPRKTPIYQVLPNGYGYIDLARLPLVEAQKAMDAMMKTPGLIFDMRGYPNGTAWEIGPRLTEKKGVTAAQFRRPYQAAPAFIIDDPDGNMPNYSFEQKMPLPKGAIYQGKVVVLINEDAISQSEHTCLFFEAATTVTFIGSPTNGANGDVTNLVLPGGISVSFSGHDVRHADGRQLQRVGIQPHLKVEPTPQGIREGRDEVLEAAVKFLNSTAQK